MNRIMIMTQSQIDKLIAENVEKAVHEQKENDEYDLLKKQTDLAILANQINPHFLYNTLECICSMALINGDRSVADITLALSQYFRYSISGREGIVTLKEELDNLKNYISIQQFRFPKKFKIHFGPMEGLQEIGIPKLSLQPLVENAIIHGLKDTTLGGEIHIEAKKMGNILEICVSDNGTGMNLEKLDRLRESIRDEGRFGTEGGSHSGIGLRNVNKRIKLYYGLPFGITVDSCEGIGTEVWLSLPVQTGMGA